MLSSFIDIERLTHSIKTMVACLLGLFFAKLISLPADQWVVITIIVVMCAQIYVGSVLQKAYLRFLGTLIGCLFASFTILLVGTTPPSIAVTIGLSSFIFSYFATGQESLSYAGTLGAVTTAIIMLGQQPTLIFALERFLEISLGLLIATLVSQFVLPIQAVAHLRRSQSKTLEQLRDYYSQAMTTHQENLTLNYQELDESIVKSLLKQRQLAKESARERLGLLFNPEHFSQFLAAEREILRAITFMRHALTHIDGMASKFAYLPRAHQFNGAILDALTVLISTIESEETSDQTIYIPSLDGIKKEFHENMSHFSAEDLLYLNGFLFSSEILINNLKKLAHLYHILPTDVTHSDI